MENMSEEKKKTRRKRVKMTGPLLCMNCGKIFEDQPKLVRHMRRVHPPEDKMCLCNICNKTFKTKGMLNDHKVKVHCIEEHTACDICSKKFKNTYRLRLHMKVVHVHLIDSLPRKQCELCGKDFRNITLLNQHVKRVHTKPTQCKICLKELKSSIYLRRHMINVHLTKSRKCDFCPKEFKDKYCYVTHLKKCHPLEYVKYKGYNQLSADGDTKETCNICDTHFISKMALYYHMQKKHDSENEEKALESFKEEFKKHLYKPKRIKKETVKPTTDILPKIEQEPIKSVKIRCDLCSKHLKSERGLKLHFKKCPKIKPSNDIQEVCVDDAVCSDDDCNPMIDPSSIKTEVPDASDSQKSIENDTPPVLDTVEVMVDVKPELFYVKPELPEDYDAKATDPILYICNECGESFSKINNLKKHIKRMHSIQKLKPIVYYCNYCGRGFQKKADLRKHKKELHISGEECVCSLCSKRLIHSENLRRHMINRHSYSKWACESCGKIFSTKTKLCQHVRYAHPKENAKISCEMCKKDYKSKLHLKDHMKSVHSLGSSVSVCEICSKEYKNIIRLRKHVAKAHNTSKMIGKPFMCKYCKKMFKTDFYMARHIKYLHESNVSYSCGVCAKVFASEFALKGHTSRMHGDGEGV